MSDDDMCYDEEDYDIEYDPEDSEEEGDVEIENLYYQAKSSKSDRDYQAALTSFQKILENEEAASTEWYFKALKQSIKVAFLMRSFDKMIDLHKQLLKLMADRKISPNEGEHAFQKILDIISATKEVDILEKVYNLSLDHLKESKNERLWFKIRLKLAKVYFDRREYKRLKSAIHELKSQCEANALSDSTKSCQLLEVLALEIQMSSEFEKDNHKLKRLCQQAENITTAVAHPLVTGVVKECSAKMHLRDGNYEDAFSNFFDAFKAYSETSGAQNINCLKYVVLTAMLLKSNINPFDAQEAKAYKNHPEIQPMLNLLEAYQRRDLRGFEKILARCNQALMGDSFIKEYIEIMLTDLRTAVAQHIIKPYTKIRLATLASELNIDVEETERLIASCILDRVIRGRIDMINGVLILMEAQKAADLRSEAMLRWVDQLESLNQKILGSVK